MNQPDHFADVAKFNEACGVYRVKKFGDELPPHVLAMRRALVTEEYNELMYAISHNDRVGIADACADLAYVAIGWMWALRFETKISYAIYDYRFSIDDLVDFVRKDIQDVLSSNQIFQIDLLVTSVFNLGIAYGLPMDAVWREVQRSNMAKINPDGTVTRRADGKILKPAGWTPPDIAGVLERAKNG